MSIDSSIADYELADQIVVTAPAQLRALADPLRATVLDLLLERAATVAELATAVGRPKSTVAHHVNVLVETGMLRVVRTRRVRAIDERYYGRTARVFYVGVVNRPGEDPTTVHANALSVAAAESLRPRGRQPPLDSSPCVPKQSAAEFWERVVALSHEFAQLPSGDTAYGLRSRLVPDRLSHPARPDRRSRLSAATRKAFSRCELEGIPTTEFPIGGRHA